LISGWSRRVPGCVLAEHPSDAGHTWFGFGPTQLAHRDSAVAAARLDDGSLIVVYNNSASDRRKLAIVRTADGVHWSAPYALENDPRPAYDGPVRREYSYPFLIATADGRFHVVYTWQRKRIRHTTFTAAWAKSALR
jgi:predicted neuraminidase